MIPSRYNYIEAHVDINVQHIYNYLWISIYIYISTHLVLISSSRWRICLERATLLAVKSEAWSLMSSTSLCSGDSEALKL